MRLFWDEAEWEPPKVAMARLSLRVDFSEDRAIGPGKIRLLEAIRDTGSITQAGIALGMSYRWAWLLVYDMNNCFHEAVIAAQAGGSHGGGASLTPFGERLIDEYRAIEAEAHAATVARLGRTRGGLQSARGTDTGNEIARCAAPPYDRPLGSASRQNAAEAPRQKFGCEQR